MTSLHHPQMGEQRRPTRLYIYYGAASVMFGKRPGTRADVRAPASGRGCAAQPRVLKIAQVSGSVRYPALALDLPVGALWHARRAGIYRRTAP